MLTLKTNLATYCQNPQEAYNQYFLIHCLRIGSLFEACAPNPGLGSAQKSLGTVALAMLA